VSLYKIFETQVCSNCVFVLFQLRRGDEHHGVEEPDYCGRHPHRPEDGHRLRVLLQQPGEQFDMTTQIQQASPFQN
jgi:hypothetical protein